MLVCYLDDSSNDGIVCSLGGYIATEENWQQYELAAPTIYQTHGISILHTKDLQRAKGEFKDWSLESRTAFVCDLFDHAKRCGVIGISVGARTSLGKKFTQSTNHTARISTMGLLFSRVVMAISADQSIYHLPHPPGDVKIIIEAGNKNNRGIQSHYDEVQQKGSSFDFLKGLSFVEKRSCYAIQLADFWAYYSRRMTSKILNGVAPIEVGQARPLRDACEPLNAIAAYRSPHHLKVIDRVDPPNEDGGVMTWADSYSLDPDDFMDFGDPNLVI